MKNNQRRKMKRRKKKINNLKEYIIVEVCCLDCRKFLRLITCATWSLDNIKEYCKLLSEDSNNSYIVYDKTGNKTIEYCFYN